MSEYFEGPDLVPYETARSAVPTSLTAPARRRRTLGLVLTAGCFLVVATAAGSVALHAAMRSPTATERAAAAALAVASRWRNWPAGRIFPPHLGYSTDLLTRETAVRIGIGRSDDCRSAIAPDLGRVAEATGCVAGLRASYEDRLLGTVYTVGLLAFPDARHAGAFLSRLRSAGSRMPLRALAFARTASGRFNDAALQVTKTRRMGPYVVLAAAGYADGRSARRDGERRPSIFAPAAQLAAEILAPLARPVTVHCTGRSWAC